MAKTLVDIKEMLKKLNQENEWHRINIASASS